MLRSPALSAGPWNARRRNPVARGAAILGVAFVLCCSPVPPAATLIDFNTPGQLTTLFATPDTTNLDSQVAGVGFDGTGGAEQPAAVNAQYWTLRTSFGGADPMWQTELLWNSGGISLPVYGSIGMMAEPLAFPRSVAQRPSTVENDSGTANRIPFTGFHFGTGTFDLIAYDPIVGDQRIQGIPDEEGLFPAVSWAENTWYRSFVQIAYNSSVSQYIVSAQTYSIDQDGFDVVWMQNVSGLLTSTALAGTASVYTYFSTQLDSGSSGPLDNFDTEAVTINPVSEPATWATATTAIAAGCQWLIRRRPVV